MKRIIYLLLSVVLLLAFAVPTMAAGEAVVYTSKSSFTVGGTVKIDEMKTKQNIMDLGKSSDEYNAALEGNVQYYWFRNDSYYKDGPSITIGEGDRGCEFYCKVYLFSDADRTQQCGTYDSAKFTIAAEFEYTLELMQAPNKVVYNAGEKLDMKGLWIRIITPEGYIDSRDGKDLTYTKEPLVNAGEQKIKVSYNDAFTFIFVTVKEHVHSANLTKVGAKAASCTEDGNVEYYSCSCGKYFKDAAANTEITDKSSVVVKASHSFGTEWGYKGADGHAHVCSCGVKDEMIAHTPNIAAPTATEDQVCTACGHIIAPKTGTDTPPAGSVATDPASSGDVNKLGSSEEFPWWGILLIVVAIVGVGVVVALPVIKKK